MTIILYIHTYTQHVWAQCSLPQIWIISEGLSRHATSDHSLPTSSVPGQARTQKTCLAAWQLRLEKGNATQLHASTTCPFHLPPRARGTTFRHMQKDAAELCLSFTGSVLLTLPLCLLCLHLKLPVQKVEKVLIETENTFGLNKYSIILTS